MRNSSTRGAHLHRPSIRLRAWRPIALLALLASAAGCQQNGTMSADEPKSSAYLDMVLPRKIEIQSSLTKPAAMDSTGNTNGIEIVLAVTDLFGDEIKCLGTFNFELHQTRLASGDRLGNRVGFWSVPVSSEADVRAYWDRWSRFYRFQIQLDERVLPPGRYILSAQYMAPGGEKLFDEYQFTHTGRVSP